MPRLSSKHLKWLLLPLLAIGGGLWLRFAPISARVHTVASERLVGEVLGTGTLEARLTASISPRITGRLSSVLVDQGDLVAKGQLLATLEDADALRQLEVARAAQAGAAATVDRVKVDATRAAIVLQQADLDHRRTASLAESKSISDSELDKARERLRVAETDLERARAAIVEAERLHASAASQVAYQQELLKHTQLLAPFDGFVIRRERDPGSVVAPGGSVLRLAASSEIWVSAWIDESAIAGLAPDRPARVVFRSEPEKDYPGRVARIGREVDRETREFLIDVRLDQLPQNWSLGQRAEVRIEVGSREGVLAVPSSFIFHRDGKPGVFRIANGNARWQPVTVGLRSGARVEIREGLSAGDRVALALKPSQDLEGRSISSP